MALTMAYETFACMMKKGSFIGEIEKIPSTRFVGHGRTSRIVLLVACFTLGRQRNLHFPKCGAALFGNRSELREHKPRAQLQRSARELYYRAHILGSDHSHL